MAGKITEPAPDVKSDKPDRKKDSGGKASAKGKASAAEPAAPAKAAPVAKDGSLAAAPVPPVSPGAAAAAASPSTIVFPMEGESKWITVMRALGLGTLVCTAAVGGIFHFFTGDDSFVESQQLAMILGGVVFLLVVEYFIFLKIVIPRQADYGRYVINKDSVDFFPLTALGLGVGPKPEKTPMAKFMGVTTGRIADKKGKISYAAFLVHSTSRGRTINVRSFPSATDAESFAVRLAGQLRLNMVSGLRKKIPAKRAI